MEGSGELNCANADSRKTTSSIFQIEPELGFLGISMKY